MQAPTWVDQVCTSTHSPSTWCSRCQSASSYHGSFAGLDLFYQCSSNDFPTEWQMCQAGQEAKMFFPDFSLNLSPHEYSGECLTHAKSQIELPYSIEGTRVLASSIPLDLHPVVLPTRSQYSPVPSSSPCIFPQSLEFFGSQLAAYNLPPPSLPTMNPSLLTRSRGFECQTCGKKLKNKQNLETHVEAIHKKSRRFICSTCGETFPYQQSRNRHQKRCPMARAHSSAT
ncbi:hypothetical protein BT96DRAFT_204354 [Gymnopus androsaceus JB14]|uniref:C2H2-type domain-containing protein n=1 Tax=Gymnopus androsaceus JB14 TaxID=1447944 RepID=A0A6A4IC73_9AGAR|nr:hypothetical protein BT96DRAFT_204354 [Gymnopus androsaceus JB14]